MSDNTKSAKSTKKDIIVVSATAKPREEDTIVYKSIKRLSDSGLIADYAIFTNNKDSLARVYNSVLFDKANKNTRIIFVHDDVVIDDLFVDEKVHEYLDFADIVGVAGIGGKIEIKPPVLWHLLGHPSQMKGEVAHFSQTPDGHSNVIPFTNTTKYGDNIADVSFIDGVFIAVDTDNIINELGIKFDENNPAKFHFYDLNFCLDALNSKRRAHIMVAPIRITHASPGLQNTTRDWLVGQDYFIKKSKEIINGRKQ